MVYEECEYWEKRHAHSKRKCEQYRESVDRLGAHLEEEKVLADAQRQNYEQKLARLSSQLEEGKTLAAAQRQNYEKKLARIGSQLEEEKSLAAAQRQSFELELSRLNSLHIRSVNLTGTGLEPVSDQEFGTAFRDLRDQVPPLPPGRDVLYRIFPCSRYRKLTAARSENGVKRRTTNAQS